jgi:hypothetical protein
MGGGLIERLTVPQSDLREPDDDDGAIDRLVHHATILQFTGESHPLRDASKPAA